MPSKLPLPFHKNSVHGLRDEANPNLMYYRPLLNLVKTATPLARGLSVGFAVLF